jgi:membrane-associated phospholipid phosphatase
VSRQRCLTSWAAATFLGGALAVAAPCAAQGGALWPTLATGVAITALTDERVSAFALSHHDRALDRGAKALAPFGEARYLVPGLVGSVVVTRLAAPRPVADAALRIALSYVAADGVESVLKPLVGRHRPSDGRGPWRFRPFRNQEEWHSFPSAHVVHTLSLATALSIETHQRWVAIPAYGISALVGAQRVYTGAHWGSDVVASAALAIGVARMTDGALRRRGLAHLLRPVDQQDVRQDAAPDGEAEVELPLRIEAMPRGVALSWSF